MSDYNEKIMKWGEKNLNAMKSTMDALDIKHSKYSRNSKPLRDNITVKFYTDENKMVKRISYGMPRSGVFVEKGVGRGHPIASPRAAKKWFSIPTDMNFSELEDIVADEDVTMIVNKLKIK